MHSLTQESYKFLHFYNDTILTNWTGSKNEECNDKSSIKLYITDDASGFKYMNIGPVCAIRFNKMKRFLMKFD